MTPDRFIFFAALLVSITGCDVFGGGNNDGDDPGNPPDRPSFSVALASPLDQQPEHFIGRYPSCPDFSFAELNQRGEVASSTYWQSPERPIPASSGYSASLYNTGVLQSLGLKDPLHTGPTAEHDSLFTDLNDTGQVTGQSTRYLDGMIMGASAWLRSDGQESIIGLLDAEHTGVDGWQHNSSTSLNDAGQVIGSASRTGLAGDGQSAWLSSDGTSYRLGFIDELHTRADGRQSSTATVLNDAGQVLGKSTQYATLTTGQSLWLYANGTTQTIGLQDALHTSQYGTSFSSALQLNNAGEVVGYSVQYDSGTERSGESYWLYNAGGYFIFPNGTQNHLAIRLNEASQVVGTRYLYDEIPGQEEAPPQSVWLYSDGIIHTLNPAGEEYIRPDGYYRSAIHYQFLSCHRRYDSLAESGHVIGSSVRFDAMGNDLGQSSWLYRDGQTRVIGPVDAEHTRATDGYRFSSASFLNSAGQVVGYASRYNNAQSPDEQIGATAWFYDSNEDELIELVLSTNSSGYASSHVDWLTESGIVLGSYHAFAEDDSDTGQRLYYFNKPYGLFDLADLVTQGMEDWRSLDKIVAANEHGQILGIGTHKNSSEPAYFLLSPADTANTN